MADYDLEKDMDMKDKNVKHTLAITKIAICIFVIVDLITGNDCYDLLVIFFITQLAESIRFYRVSKRKIDFVEMVGSVIAILGISLLYLCFLKEL